MNKRSLREIEDSLPNGFHDALPEKLIVDVATNSARIELQVFTGDPDAETDAGKESYRRAVLEISDLLYFVIDAPNYEPCGGKPVRIDAGDAMDRSDPESPRPCAAVPPGAFAHWFFVTEWNSSIHVAAHSAAIRFC